MKKLILSVTMLAIATSTIFVACKTDTTKKCDTCTIKESDAKVNTKIGSNNLNLEVWKSNDDANYQYAYARLNDKNGINNILHDAVNLNLNPNDEIASIVLYVDKHLNSSNDVSVNEENVIGYGLYFIKEKKLRYSFFKKSANKEFNLVPELNCEAKYVETGNMYNIYLLFLAGQHVTAINITNADVLFSPTLSVSHTLGYNIDYLIRQDLKLSKLFKTTLAPSQCPMPCSGKDKTCQETLHGKSCDKTSDKERSTEQATYLITRGTPTSHVDSAYNIPLQYMFRDSFLVNSIIGQKYIDYYYDFSPNVYLTADILLHTPPYLLMLNKKINHLLANHSNVVFFDNSFKAQTLQLIQYYKNAAPNSRELNNLSDIENDVHLYSGKTVGEIRSMIY
jgi:hypothetical protein